MIEINLLIVYERNFEMEKMMKFTRNEYNDVR